MLSIPALVGIGCTVAKTSLVGVPALDVVQERRVLCYGESITLGFRGRGVTYPSVLQHMRPDLVVTNGGLNGDVFSNAARLRSLLDADAYDDVVLLIGTNDPIVEGISPIETFRNILSLVEIVRERGARAWVLTPTPSKCLPPSYFCLNLAERQAHTREVANLIMAEGYRSDTFVALDLRDTFTVFDWRAMTSDGLHLNAAGYTAIGRLVSEVLTPLPTSSPDDEGEIR